MQLIFLGTAGYHPNEQRHTSCLLLPEVGVLLDAGTGLFRLRGRLQTERLDIFLTHAHLDHIVGLTFLLGLQHHSPLTVTVHGDGDKLSAIQRHLFSEATFPVPLAGEFLPLSTPVPLAGGGRLSYFPLTHPGGSLGFRLDWPGHSLAYVTDTTASPNAEYVRHLRSVDLLVHECNFGDEHVEFARLTGHSHTTAVAEIAREAQVGRLVLTHFDPSDERPDPIGLATARRIFPATELAHDLMQVNF
ncbi:MAG: MBL fold metallo-hydrolase [Pirellulales bacterium]